MGALHDQEQERPRQTGHKGSMDSDLECSSTKRVDSRGSPIFVISPTKINRFGVNRREIQRKTRI
jgi:hypothetical protein